MIPTAESWRDLLACPTCQAALKGDPQADRGTLTCSGCSAAYPVTQGIPRLLVPGPLRADNKQTQDPTQAVFEFKWKRQSEWGMKGKTATFMENWILSKYGWNTPAAYQSFMQKHAVLLDAGSGLGREAIRMAQANPRARVVGLELSACIEEAKKHAESLGLTNLLWVQADLLAPPLKAGRFDFIFSEGVLHHTPDTRRAFERLSLLLGDQGEFAFYVYRKKAPLREYADDYVRQQIQNVPLEQAWALMEPLTRLGKSLAEKKTDIEIPDDIPLLGFKKGRFDLQRWVYNTLFKCFWNENMTFQENVLINFDWYLPRFAWRHSEEEIRGWLKDAGMTLQREQVEEAGITVRAVKNGGGPL